MYVLYWNPLVTAIKKSKAEVKKKLGKLKLNTEREMIYQKKKKAGKAEI